jgi:UDP-N-acetylmuramyl pentapeptide phosphotransferase/UDP-N-acetylglucosamine-1-phosphate transferase
LIGSDNALADLALAAASAAVTIVALLLLRHFAARLPLAHPNARSLHTEPIPRVGGLAIWAGALSGSLISPPAGIAAAPWLAGFALVATVSAVDDWRGVAPPLRLAVHTIAAAIAVTGLSIDSSAGAWDATVTSIFAAVGIVWAANLYNFMDGSDGLAALMAVTGFATLGAAATIAGAPAGCFYATASASLVFLTVNAPPARMFMGDVGAVPLGFVAATWGIAGTLAGVYPAWLVALAFLPFWSDATVTLIARLARGERVIEPHRSHYYQRLVQLGVGHRGTLLCFGALMVGTAVSALCLLLVAPTAGWIVLGVWIAIHAAVFAGIEYHWRKRCLPVQ